MVISIAVNPDRVLQLFPHAVSVHTARAGLTLFTHVYDAHVGRCMARTSP